MALSNTVVNGLIAVGISGAIVFGLYLLTPKDAETQRKEQIQRDSKERIAAFEAREAAEAAEAKAAAAAPAPAPASTGARRKTRRRKSRKSSRRK